MRIIHYIPSIDRTAGGTSTYMQVLSKELGKLVELHIVTHETDNPLDMSNSEVHYIPRWRPFSPYWKNVVSSLLKKVRPDVVHVNCCWTPDCAAFQRSAQSQGYKVVLSPHGMLEPWIIHRHYWTRKLPALTLYQKQAIRKADCLHVTAENERKNLLALGYNDHVQVVSLGIDTDGIKMKPSWKKTRQILFLSRVHVKKGINYLIEAVSRLKMELQDYNIVVAGEGDADYVRELRCQIESEELQDTVKLIGGVYGDEKWKLYRESDIFILPTHSENFGLVIAESLASGTPVITTNGTPWKDIDSFHAGAWIEIGAKPLVSTLRKFLNYSEAELERMGLNGRRLIETKYSAKNMADNMRKMYGKILGQPVCDK